MPQNRLFELLERTPGLDPELVDKTIARLLVDRERFGLSARSVERDHQLGSRPLAQRVLTKNRLEFLHELRTLAERQLLLDPFFDCAEPKLVQAGTLLFEEARLRDVPQRRTAPERQGLAQLGHCKRRIAGGKLVTRFCAQLLEAVEVELARLNPQAVSGPLRDESLLPARLAYERAA